MNGHDVQHRDCFDSLATMRDAGGVRLIVTSPPYPNARTPEVTGWELQGKMPERAGVMPISTRLYFDASARGPLVKRSAASIREILSTFCLAIIADPTEQGLARAQAGFLADTKGYWA